MLLNKLEKLLKRLVLFNEIIHGIVLIIYSKMSKKCSTNFYFFIVGVNSQSKFNVCLNVVMSKEKKSIVFADSNANKEITKMNDVSKKNYYI